LSGAFDRAREEPHMTTATEGQELTRVGPGTPMGELMRQYWLPALKASELVAGGDPVRLMLLGEKLIAFRDRSGRVGVMDHRCPHRCASLFYGRNEDTACAASITAGSSPPMDSAWRCRTFRQTRTSAPR